MTQFAPGAGRFAIEMEVSVRHEENFGGFRQLPDQIQHGAIAQRSSRTKRQAEHGTQMIFKLAGGASFDGPMAGIVNARSHFVGHELSATFEKFNREDTDIVEL